MGSAAGRLIATTSRKPVRLTSISLNTASAARRPGSAPWPGTSITSSLSGRDGRCSPAAPCGRGRAGPSSIDAASLVRSTPRAPRSATASTRARQSPSSGCWGRARATITAAPSDRSQPSSSDRAEMFSRSVTLRPSRSERKSPTAASLARSGARARSTSCPISVETMRSSDAGGGVPRARRRSWPTRSSATRSSITSVSPSPASTARSSSGDRQATASTAESAPSTTTLASSACPAARATAGSPAPDSTASETSSNASRKGLWAARSLRSWAAATTRL